MLAEPSHSVGQSVSRRLVALWQDDRGFVISIELILIVTILVIGLIAGLTALRDAVVSELTDVARGVQQLHQSYQANGATGAASSTSGSGIIDRVDVETSDVSFCTAVYGLDESL
ncbi:Flp family type IVb pilin [Rhodopirellula sp. MGV]|uniref:Flp family type IVb pilin n=1 Tax=Rhodopirellula sp. MGV TaxID=2023130 RepID=UPI000B968C13|nr:hypothetical protein [Rhodopirellula sp. MGV]OYP37697.1 hypothetical protein CGZ80_04220 [Rhodopirellula sp. MGV]PNY37135.1 hypothetical protein C2E31_09075 [Rhodopirellula baltica]